MPLALVKNPNTRTLEAILGRVAVGDTITYSTLSDAIGTPVTGSRARGWLAAARRTMERDKRVVFLVSPKIGLKRASAEDVIADAEKRASGVGRASNRVLRRLATLDVDALPPPLRERAGAVASVAGLAVFATRAPQVDAVRAALAASHGPQLAIGRTLDVMRARNTGTD